MVDDRVRVLFADRVSQERGLGRSSWMRKNDKHSNGYGEDGKCSAGSGRGIGLRASTEILGEVLEWEGLKMKRKQSSET